MEAPKMPPENRTLPRRVLDPSTPDSYSDSCVIRQMAGALHNLTVENADSNFDSHSDRRTSHDLFLLSLPRPSIHSPPAHSRMSFSKCLSPIITWKYQKVVDRCARYFFISAYITNSLLSSSIVSTFYRVNLDKFLLKAIVLTVLLTLCHCFRNVIFKTQLISKRK